MSQIRTFRQLLNAIHENGGGNNWAEDGGFDADLHNLAEDARDAGLITIRMGWGEDRYYALTGEGRRYIGVAPDPSIFSRAVAFLQDHIRG